MEFKNKKGQPIGTLKDRIFRKVVNKDRHLFKRYDAWGIDYEVWQALRGDCDEIRIKETKDGVVYSIPFDDFGKKAIVENVGEGMQAFCPRSTFSTRNT